MNTLATAALYGHPMIPGYADVSSVESLRMPESPNAVKQQLAAPSSGRSSAPTLKHATTAGMNGSHSPHSSNSAPASGGRTPSPPAETSRPLAKLKRFLATLQQFGADISPETGERMHALILGLASSTLPIEEFHQKVQDLTNYPLRPFVVPFLKANLPLLQADLLHCARLAHQTPQQYARQHLTLEGCGTEPGDIFQTDAKECSKRRTPPDTRPRENGFSDNSSDGPPPAKRQQTLPSPTLGPRMSPAGAPSHLPPGLNLRYDEGLYRYDRYDRYDRDLGRPYYSSVHRDFPDDRDMEDEWKNIHTMLNCILGMVEKTKRALAILQHRSYSEPRTQDVVSLWRSRHLDGTEFDIKKRAADILTTSTTPAHYKAPPPTAATPEEVARRRPVSEGLVSSQRGGGQQPPLLPLSADEVVHDVSVKQRQTVVELQKAAESKASELLAAERAKMERMLSEARRQAAEETLAALNHQDESTESCWNCGRKANETCSGCNVARYCGAFCQHKDWENHHRACGTTTSSNHASPSASPPGAGKQSPIPPARTIVSEVVVPKTEVKN